MIKMFVTDEDVVKKEPVLINYIREDQVDFSDLISEAKKDVIQDLIDLKYIVRKLCIPLILQAKQTKAETYDSDLTDEDYAQRNLIVIEVTSLTDEDIFTVQGTNDDGNNYTTVATITVPETGTYTEVIFDLYKKYRIRKTTANSCEYYSYMTEDKYNRLCLYRSLSLIFKSLSELVNDKYFRDYEEYQDKYMGLLQTRFYYDEDDSGDINQLEDEDDYSEVKFYWVG